MTKKDYLIPSVEVIEMGYQEPVCAGSGDAEAGTPDFLIDEYIPDWII